MNVIDRDALIFELTKLIRTSTGEYKHGLETARIAVSGMPTAAANNNAWISVKDKMPMLIETVLFTGKRYDGGWFGTKRGYFDGTFWRADDVGTIYSTTPVTHWMPLPEPPEEG